MKRIFLLLTALVITTLSFAQAPQGINYQGVARNNFGLAIANTSITVKFQILQSSTIVYAETHFTTTDTFGLYSLVIGSGPATLGSFSSIPWSAGNMSLQVDVNGTTIGTMPFQSVPYALYSGSSSSGITTITTNSTLATPSVTSGTVNLSLEQIVPNVLGTYGGTVNAYPIINVDPFGRVISASTQTFTSGSGTMTSLTVGPGLTSSPSGTITTTGGVDLPTFPGVAGTYGSSTVIPTYTVDTYGRITGVTSSPINGLLPGGGLNGQVLQMSSGVPAWINPATPTTTVSVTAPINGDGAGIPLNMNSASTTTDGYLTKVDWNNFNNKVSSLTAGSGIIGPIPTGTNVIINADVNSPLWNAYQLQNFNISPATPTPGQVLTYTAGNWTPTTIGGSLPTPTVGSLLYSDASNVWTPTNPTGIYTDGTNIGMGTNAPGAKIDIQTSANAIGVTSSYTAGAIVDLTRTGTTGSSNPVLQITTDNSNGYGIQVNNTSGAAIITSGGGPYVIGANLQGTGSALVGDVQNGANGNAVWGNIADNISTGTAGLFTNNNPTNTVTTLSVNTSAAGGYSGDFSGGLGLKTDKIQISGPTAPTVGYVLTATSASGAADWQPAGGISGASNGLSVVSNSVVLGGTLTNATTVTQSTNNVVFTSSGGNFQINSTAGASNALSVSNSSSSGQAANINTTVSTNTAIALSVATAGMGPAGTFTITNGGNSAPALVAGTAGTGPAFTANAGPGGVPAIVSNGPLKLVGPIIDATSGGAPGDILTSQGGGTVPKWMSATTALGTAFWSTTGNTGTTPGTNFIGTNDAKPLMIKVNGQNSGYIDWDITIANTSFGFQALNTNTGLRNTATGYQALSSSNSGNANTANGYAALLANTSGANNTASGSLALNGNTTGSQNTANGQGALRLNTTGLSNTANGMSALINNSTGSSNLANGMNALFSNVAGSNATAIGTNAMQYSNSSATAFTNYNVAVGFEAIRGSTTASANTGNYNTGTGYQTLWSNTSGNQNTANGYLALYSNNTGSSNTANGWQSLYSNTSGNNNTGGGYQALYNTTVGGHNTAYGEAALTSNVAGSYATAIGSNAMYYSNNTSTTYTNYNVAVGFESIRGSSTASANTGNYNTAVGYQTLWSNTTGSYNIANGVNSLYSNTSGNNNTAYGYQAGYTATSANANTTGSNNTFIGYNSGPGTATQLTNATAIGANALVNTSNALVLGGMGANAVNVGIGTATPGAVLDVVSNTTVATINSNNTGSAGSAGLFTISGAGNNNDVLKASTSGNGYSGNFIGGNGLRTDGVTTAVLIVPNGGVVLGGTDYFVLIPNGTTGNITLPIANPANAGRTYVIKAVGSAYNLQGGSTYVSTSGVGGQNNIPANSVVRITCDGSAWQAW
jgi:hypothetical protein